MAATTALAFKDALVDLLTADAQLGGAGVQVSYGFLARDVERETIAVGGIEWDEETWQPLGAQRKDETYSVGLFIFVTNPGDSQKEATERALALFARVETLLQTKANITLGGISWLNLEPAAVMESPSDEGYQAVVEARVRVRARK
jgi:hypothetical protein